MTRNNVFPLSGAYGTPQAVGGFTVADPLASWSSAKPSSKSASHPGEYTRTSYHEQFSLPSFEDTTFVVFGYGSILWKQEFEYEAEYPAYIKGYTRVFYQGTCVHRGQPGKPGRVVTLLPSADKEERVYGKAYQLPSDPEKLKTIFTALDVREGGYDRLSVILYNAHPSNGSNIKRRATPCTASTAMRANESTQNAPLSRQYSSDIPDNEDGEEVLDILGHPNAPATKPHKNIVYLCYIATEKNGGYVGEAPMEVMAREILSRKGVSGPNREYLFLLADCLREMGATDPHVFQLDAVAKQLLYGREAEFASGAVPV